MLFQITHMTQKHIQTQKNIADEKAKCMNALEDEIVGFEVEENN